MGDEKKPEGRVTCSGTQLLPFLNGILLSDDRPCFIPRSFIDSLG